MLYYHYPYCIKLEKWIVKGAEIINPISKVVLKEYWEWEGGDQYLNTPHPSPKKEKKTPKV